MLIRLLPILAAIAGATTSYRLHKKLRGTQRAFESYRVRAVPLALTAGVPEEEVLELWAGPPDWTVVISGGDCRGGIVANLKMCPGHQCYYVQSNVLPQNGFPNPAQIPNLVQFPPYPGAPDTCPDTCVHVTTHRWRGWDLEVDTNNGAFRLMCHSFAQFECREPVAGAPPPPYEGHPKDDVRP